MSRKSKQRDQHGETDRGNARELELAVKIRDKEERILALLGPVESYILLFQRILVWELPYASAVLFLTVHLLFW